MLQNINAGTVINFTDFIFENRDIVKNDDIYKRINGRSYIRNSNVCLDELTYIKMLHYNYDGNVAVGEMIVNKAILDETREIFSTLFALKYQIYSMRLIDDFWIEGDALKTDRNSVIHNNSSCFCYRKIAKQENLSNHALGIAIDINPLDNPYTPKNKNGSFDDSLLTDYEKNILINRKEKAKMNKHIITLGDSACMVFDSVGFECGGIWPLQSEKWPSDWQHFEPNAEKMPIIIKRIEERREYLARKCIDEQTGHSTSTLKKMIDRINPLTEIPKSEMRLYFIDDNYFQTIDELLQYCKVNRLFTNELGILEYYRNLAGRSDVIKKSNGTTFMLYTVADEDGYGIYNYEKSVYFGEFTWEFNYGSIIELYNPFKDRGIVFENDIYAKQDERNKQLLKICRERNLFGMGKNNSLSSN